MSTVTEHAQDVRPYGTWVPEAIRKPLAGVAWPMALAGSVLVLISGLLSWTIAEDILDKVNLDFNPAPLQYIVMATALICLVLLLVRVTPAQRMFDFVKAGRGTSAAGIGVVAVMTLVFIGVGVETGAIANANPGAYVGLVGGILMALGGGSMPEVDDHMPARHVPGWVAIALIIVMLAAGLFLAAHVLAIPEEDAWGFIATLVALGAVFAALSYSRMTTWLGSVAEKQRRVMTLAAFAAAFAFPLTQNGSDANMSVAVQVLIFAATAVGLNIVVGLAGLLDLGYIAFLGAGAYVGAILSESAFSTVGWHPHFLVVALIGAGFSAILGLIIGSPTLRVSGDYLAIVTLAFGEIFRLAMFNLDGNNGPNLTNGPNGIPAVPSLKLFGFDFGETHTIAGIEITRFGNYYLLLLLIMAIIVMVFTRWNNSRIGRGWVAIREDEKAAEAMGVNVFALKLLAFAGGASLAGLAGSVKAHVDVSVTPDQYDFLESAFLLAAVVLGGMGTVTGVMVGAVLLKLLPEKLRFFNDYRLLMFGVLLVVMMRFRPEGLVSVHRQEPTDDLPKRYRERLRPETTGAGSVQLAKGSTS